MTNCVITLYVCRLIIVYALFYRKNMLLTYGKAGLASGLVSGNQVNRSGLHMQRLQTVNAIISYLLIFIRQSKKLVVARR
jgi:hypothetical protein